MVPVFVAVSTIVQTLVLNPVRLFFNAAMSIAEVVDFVIVSSQPYIGTRTEIRQTTELPQRTYPSNQIDGRLLW